MHRVFFRENKNIPASKQHSFRLLEKRGADCRDMNEKEKYWGLIPYSIHCIIMYLFIVKFIIKNILRFDQISDFCFDCQ